MVCSSAKDVSIRFTLGEVRPLKFKASYPNHPEFTIPSATYEVWRYNKMIDNGDLTVDGHELTMYWEATQRGFFDLYISIKVADSNRVKHFLINVD